MLNGLSRLKLSFAVVASLTVFALGISAGDLPKPFSGSLLGVVVDPMGTPQMGASVILFDRYERLVRRTLTSSDGKFGFMSLPPAFYSIKISIPSLITASRDRIAVRAGLSSVLQIRMATLFSSVELEYTKPASAMSDDWKWVLRSSTATRVITRDLPDAPQSTSSSISASPEQPEKVFTGTKGVVTLSAGDAASLLSNSSLASSGTSFALETTMYGRNQITLSGIFGESMNSGMPAMGLRATYARNDANGESSMPEITVTAQQFYLPGRLMNGSGPGASAPVRNTSLSYYDTMDFADGIIHLEYGSTLQTLAYFDNLNTVSPFARMTASLGSAGSLSFSYSNGGNPNELYIHQFGEQSDLAGTIGALSSVPDFSLRDGSLQLQRTQNYEVGYTKACGRRTYAISAFYENTNDGRLNVAGDLSSLNPQDLLPDISTTTTIYNMGHYNRNGLMASVDQKVDDNLEIALAAGTMGGFTRTGSPASSPYFLDRADHAVASLEIRSTIPRSNTRIISDYEYVGAGAIIPEHIFSTQRLYSEPGLNIIIRQPLPSFFGVGKLELSADLRNLLAQGYLPMSAANGRQMLLVQAPRTLQGGLNIVF